MYHEVVHLRITLTAVVRYPKIILTLQSLSNTWLKQSFQRYAQQVDDFVGYVVLQKSRQLNSFPFIYK